MRGKEQPPTNNSAQHPNEPFPRFPTVDYIDTTTPHGQAQQIFFDMLSVARTMHARVVFDANKPPPSPGVRFEMFVDDNKESKRKPSRIRPRDKKLGNNSGPRVGPAGIKLHRKNH